MDSISRIPAQPAHLYAFRIRGEVSAEAMEAMAATMNEAFDRHDEVDMLLLFAPDFQGSEMGASLNWESMKAQLRSLSKVRNYVTVGAPQAAETMIEAFGAMIPVECQTFEADEEDQAWARLGGRPSAAVQG